MDDKRRLQLARERIVDVYRNMCEKERVDNKTLETLNFAIKYINQSIEMIDEQS